jgi:hypothetical protein
VGLTPRNVTEAVQAPRSAKSTKKEVHALNAEQAQQLLEAVRGDRLEALYVLAINTGLREGELLRPALARRGPRERDAIGAPTTHPHEERWPLFHHAQER